MKLGLWVSTALNRFPFQTANMAAALAVAIYTAINGVTFLRGVMAGLASGDPASVGLVSLAAIYSLAASQTVAQIRNVVETEKARLDEHRDHESLASGQGAAVAEARNEHALQAQGLHRVEVSVSELAEVVYGLVDTTTKMQRSVDRGVLTQPNSTQIWANLRKRTAFVGVNPRFWGDLHNEITAEGERVLRPNIKRIAEAWLPRFRPETALDSVRYVIWARDEGVSNLESVAAMLTVFRTVVAIAAHEGSVIDLRKVRIAIRKGDAPPVCFFCGAYDRAGSPVPFTLSYRDNANAFGLPRGLIDDLVDISYDPATVEANLQNARHLAENVPSYSIDDLERRYGHLVVQPDLSDLPMYVAVRDKPPAESGEWVVSGDHMILRR